LIRTLSIELKEGTALVTVVVDVDDTLIYTEHRMQFVWLELLGREIPLEAVETLSFEQIFMKYASQEQKARVREFQKRFWNVLLCLEEAGLDSLKYHQPIPFAADVLQEWNKISTIVYLTGRTENTHSLTLNELKKFGFPTHNTHLVMFKPEDYARAKGEDPTGPTLMDAKLNLFSKICDSSNVVRVIDDHPGYFPIFKQFEIPDRIGFLRPKKYKIQNYLDHGATRVIRTWKELRNDPPKPEES